MTDVELLQRLAALMGWEVIERPINRRLHYDFSGPHVFMEIDGTFWRGADARGSCVIPWRPLHDMNDAWMVVEKMQKEGYDYEIGSCIYSDEDGNPVEGHSVEFMRGLLDPYEGTHKESYIAYAPTPARAICLAALPKEGG